MFYLGNIREEIRNAFSKSFECMLDSFDPVLGSTDSLKSPETKCDCFQREHCSV